MRSLCCGLLTIASLPALAGEKTACQTRPLIDDGREWHYRTQIPGGPNGDDRCFYVGKGMKPRSELYWSAPELPQFRLSWSRLLGHRARCPQLFW